jgi:hypothetical protein
MAFADVQLQADSPSFGPYGIGGDSNTIWHNDYGSDQIYELDADNNQPPTATASPIAHILQMI